MYSSGVPSSSFSFQRSKQKLIVYLQDTELRLDFHHRDRVREVKLTDTYAVGNWRLVTVTKRGARLSLSVDGVAGVASMVVARKLHVGRELWLGGSEEAFVPGAMGAQSSPIPYFNGCVRDLRVGGRRVLLSSERHRAVAVSRCALRVERGFHVGLGQLELPLGPFQQDHSQGLLLRLEGHFKVLRPGVLATLLGDDGAHTLTFSISDDQKVQLNVNMRYL